MSRRRTIDRAHNRPRKSTAAARKKAAGSNSLVSAPAGAGGATAARLLPGSAAGVKTRREGESARPLAELPIDPARFYRSPGDLDSLVPPTEVDSTPALKRLGPPPMTRGRFPLLGFLATVYDHVASSCGKKPAPVEPPVSSPPPRRIFDLRLET